MEIRQIKKRQNFQCLFQSKSAKISWRQNNPIYGILSQYFVSCRYEKSFCKMLFIDSGWGGRSGNKEEVWRWSASRGRGGGRRGKGARRWSQVRGDPNLWFRSGLIKFTYRIASNRTPLHIAFSHIWLKIIFCKFCNFHPNESYSFIYGSPLFISIIICYQRQSENEYLLLHCTECSDYILKINCP